jgi:hypothetical protein
MEFKYWFWGGAAVTLTLAWVAFLIHSISRVIQ